MGKIDRVTFEPEDVELFRQLSHDANPLHVDPTYASRTPFGRCVVHGILGVLGTLRPVLGAFPLRIRRLEATFMRPLLVGQAYDVDAEQPGPDRFALTLHRGGSTKLALLLEYEPREVAVSADPRPPQMPSGPTPAGPVPPPAEELTLDQLEGRRASGCWAMALPALEALAARLHLEHQRLPRSQLAAIVWSSYLVGMQLPGRQALFTRLALSFASDPPENAATLDFAAEVVALERRLGLATIGATVAARVAGGNARPVATARIQALVRPEPVVPCFDTLGQLLPPSTALRGKVCVTTGASRGLGALLAVGSALAGADVVLGCRSHRQQALRVAEAIVGLGRRGLVVEGDLRERQSWQRMATQAEQQLGPVDLLVHSAFPPILPLQLGELDPEVMRDFVAASLETAVTGLQIFVPRLARVDGTVLLVSTAYAAAPPREMAHYVMVKSALEGLGRALAAEFPRVRFLVVRPPKIRTDQTNALADLSPGLPAEQVAARVIEALVAPSPPGNYRLVESEALAPPSA